MMLRAKFSWRRTANHGGAVFGDQDRGRLAYTTAPPWIGRQQPGQ